MCAAGCAARASGASPNRYVSRGPMRADAARARASGASPEASSAPPELTRDSTVLRVADPPKATSSAPPETPVASRFYPPREKPTAPPAPLETVTSATVGPCSPGRRVLHWPHRPRLWNAARTSLRRPSSGRRWPHRPGTLWHHHQTPAGVAFQRREVPESGDFGTIDSLRSGEETSTRRPARRATRRTSRAAGGRCRGCWARRRGDPWPQAQPAVAPVDACSEGATPPSVAPGSAATRRARAHALGGHPARRFGPARPEPRAH